MSSKSNSRRAPAASAWRRRLRPTAPFHLRSAGWAILAAAFGAFALMAPTLALAALNCTVTTNPVAFGVYRSSDSLPKTGRGEVVVKCTCSGLDCLGFSYSLNVQSGGSGSASARRMTRTGGTETLNYQLYVDALYLAPWVSTQTEAYLLTQMGVGQTVFVYGRIPAGQGVRVGDYGDAPGVVITY